MCKYPQACISEPWLKDDEVHAGMICITHTSDKGVEERAHDPRGAGTTCGMYVYFVNMLASRAQLNEGVQPIWNTLVAFEHCTK